MDLRKGIAMAESHKHDIYTTLVSLADTLVEGFDVLDLADRLVEAALSTLGASAAGIMLDDQRGSLRVLASSSEETRLLELLELQNNEGPCLEAFRSGHAVTVDDLQRESARWPGFGREAEVQGLRSAYAIPMRLRERVIGALNLFGDRPAAVDTDCLKLAHVLASMATIGIINHRTIRQREVLAEQLQSALNNRIVIEQAKGVIAERSNIDMGAAFELLRGAARSSRRPLIDVAAEVVHNRRAPVLGDSEHTTRPHPR